METFLHFDLAFWLAGQWTLLPAIKYFQSKCIEKMFLVSFSWHFVVITIKASIRLLSTNFYVFFCFGCLRAFLCQWLAARFYSVHRLEKQCCHSAGLSSFGALPSCLVDNSLSACMTHKVENFKVFLWLFRTWTTFSQAQVIGLSTPEGTIEDLG